MMYYTYKDDCTIIRRHFILILFDLLKFIFFIAVWAIIYTIHFNFLMGKEHNLLYLEYLLFAFVFIIINYAFIKFILALIEYYNNLIIIKDDQLIILKCSLILQDDVEVIDAYRVMKLDCYARWILANMLGYWNLIIEQQKDDVRTCHFVPRPYTILKILKDQRENVLQDRRKKYIVQEKEKVIEPEE